MEGITVTTPQDDDDEHAGTAPGDDGTGARRRGSRSRMRPGLGGATVAGEEPDESVLRVIVTAGREAARPLVASPASEVRGIDGASYRAVARALLGVPGPDRLLQRACTAFAIDPDGMTRFAAMARRAMASLVRDEAGAGEVVPVRTATAVLSVHTAMLRALGTRRAATETSYERFAAAAVEVADADGYADTCERAAAAVVELSGLSSAGVYVPGSEHARLVRGAAAGAGSADPEPEPPPFLRVDRGIFADAIAGERPLFLSSAEAIEGIAGDGETRTMVAVPMRDALGRPAGLLLALDARHRELDVDAVESLRRLGGVVEGALAAADATRRSRASLGTLPELAEVAAAVGDDVGAQLDTLAAIVARATGSDAAVVRVVDAAGRFLETPAAASRLGDGVGDVVGSRTLLQGVEATDPAETGLEECELVGIDGPPDTWSGPGRRMLELLGARSVACYPVNSAYDRRGVLYVVRRTSRAFDDADRACIRIVISHVQHVVDRHVSALQTQRAIDAARSAIRLLGEGLVAGVRTERTVRFVPRLYHEMFDSAGCRTWRQETDGTLTLLAAAGRMRATDAAPAVTRAAGAPLTLELDTDQRPHVAAVAVEEYEGTRLVVEFELSGDRTLGQEEQMLAVDVATRVGEALHSAQQAAAHERQLTRVRALQDVIALAHEQLSEAHVVSTIADEVPGRYGAHAAAVFLADAGGQLEARAVRNIPDELIDEIEQARTWVTDIARDESADTILAIASLGTDPRLAQYHAGIAAAGIADASVLVVPLTGRETTVGVLVLLFLTGLPDGIDEERETLRAFGRHVGSAIVNAREFERERAARSRTQRLLDDERESSRQVRALHEVSRTFAASLSLDETMRAVVEAMAHRLDVDAVWIRTPNERGDQLMLRAFYASQPEFSAALERMVAQPEPREDPITWQVWQTRQPVLITGGEEIDVRFAESETLRRLQPFLQRGSTVAVLPVAIPNEMLGTLTMLSIDPEHALTYDKVDVAAGVTSQAALALDNARLYQQQKNFAEVIQESLLPGRLPDTPGIELGVLYRSATAGGVEAPLIGGDFYDFLELDDGRLALAVGDVTGKGVAAAADTAMTKYIFRALAREHPSPAGFLRYANDVVCEEITPGKFVTLFYAVIDPVAGTLTCGNAGHPEPKIVRPLEPGQIEPEIDSLGMEGIALGIIPDQDYEQREYDFGPGCSLVVYTDGVVEARRDSRLYGQYRLERRLADEVGASAPQIAFAVYQDCAAYAEDGLGDDVAIVVAQRVADAPPPPGTLPSS